MKILLKKFIDGLMKRRIIGSYKLYVLAQYMISVYENCDVDMFSNGEYWLQNLIFSNGDVVAFDIGANVGEWLFPLLNNTRNYKVLAFEAAPNVFELLQGKINDPRIILEHKAMSSNDGFIYLNESLSISHISSIYDTSDWCPPSEVRKLRVPATTGDLEMSRRGFDKVDFVKIDVEGHDYHVLIGFQNAIESTNVDIFQFEYNSYTLRARRCLLDFYNLLFPRYLIFRLLPNGLEATGYVKMLDNFRQSNWVAINRDKINKDFVKRFGITVAMGHSGEALREKLKEYPKTKDALGLTL